MRKQGNQIFFQSVRSANRAGFSPKARSLVTAGPVPANSLETLNIAYVLGIAAKEAPGAQASRAKRTFRKACCASGAFDEMAG
jgi:hypothetical protein